MATDSSDQNEARLQRLEDALRIASWRFTIAVGLLTISLVLLGAVALTPFGPWVQSRLPWAMNPRFESVSAKQFIVVDGNKRRAVFGLNAPEWTMEHPHVTPVPELAALWFYDDHPHRLSEPQEYRAMIGFEKTSPAAERDNPWYEPFIRFTIRRPVHGYIDVRKWPE